MREMAALFFWVFLSDNAKLMDLHDRLGEANATPNTSGAAPWLEGRGSRPSYPLTLAGPGPRGWPIARQTIRVNLREVAPPGDQHHESSGSTACLL